MALLELRSVAIGYGHHRVLEDVNLTLERGEIVTLLGANGAGKSTLAKAVSGLLRPLRPAPFCSMACRSRHCRRPSGCAGASRMFRRGGRFSPA